MQSENTQQVELLEGENNEAVSLANLDELLTADQESETPEGEQHGEAEPEGSKDAKPTMFNDLAESLGIELDDLYALQVSTSDGEKVTIQDLKALHSNQDDIVLRELEFEERRTTQEAELRQAQNEIAEIVAGLPNGTLKPDVLEKMRAKNAARVEVEQQRTLAAIPTWSDDEQREKDLSGMAKHLERFGFAPGHLATQTDHRMLVFIRESYLREQRIQAALKKVRAGKPQPTSHTKAGMKPGNSAPSKSDARNGLESFFSNVE